MSNGRPYDRHPYEGEPGVVIEPFRGRAAWAGGRPGTDDHVPHRDETQRFTALSARLTGFDEAALEATGSTEVYRSVAVERLGAERYARLLREPEDVGEPSGELRESARAVTYLWYTGSWPGSPPIAVSPRARAEGLVWKAAGLRAPATDPRGYGSWADAGEVVEEGVR
ncbi:hypothetical protein [Streptomyces sp. NPDC047981]|uniref:hypothetical protein n=1 Tax=Streptomyces sp. NPDC047981 TaxID=3154610 RepID=UPI0034332D68